MPGNSIGKMFTVTTFGESHGPSIGCVIDGCPPGMSISESDIQNDLDRRKPGQSKLTSQRRESDEIEIVSGVFNGITTGTPICLQIKNHDQKEKDYEEIKDKFRPGHGDYTYLKKYNVRDHRGGGRASARETAARVAAGAIAKKYLFEASDIRINSVVNRVGNVDGSDHVAVEELITSLRREGDSIGAELGLEITNVPTGLGEPVFDRLDAELAYALMSINAVKGVEIGAGFDCVNSKGSEFVDCITPDGFSSNNAGGILAGISTGQDITARVAFKPASSIRVPVDTVDINNNATKIVTNGRHDPCVGLRAAPIVEAMAAIVVLDHLLRHRGQNGNN